MNFELTEEQALLRESALRWVADRAGKAALEGAADRWQEMARFGWLGMMLPDAASGLVIEGTAAGPAPPPPPVVPDPTAIWVWFGPPTST